MLIKIIWIDYTWHYEWFIFLEIYCISIITCRCTFCKLIHVWYLIGKVCLNKRSCFIILNFFLHYIKVTKYQFSCYLSKCRWMLKNLMTLNLGTELVLPSPRTHTLAMISSPKSFTLLIQVILFFKIFLKYHFKHCCRYHISSFLCVMFFRT